MPSLGASTGNSTPVIPSPREHAVPESHSPGPPCLPKPPVAEEQAINLGEMEGVSAAEGGLSAQRSTRMKGPVFKVSRALMVQGQPCHVSEVWPSASHFNLDEPHFPHLSSEVQRSRLTEALSHRDAMAQHVRYAPRNSSPAVKLSINGGFHFEENDDDDGHRRHHYHP